MKWSRPPCPGGAALREGVPVVIPALHGNALPGEPGVRLLMASWPSAVRCAWGSQERGFPFATRENLELANESDSARLSKDEPPTSDPFLSWGHLGVEEPTLEFPVVIQVEPHAD